MHLKDKNRTPQPGFVFFFESSQGSQIRVPVRGSANGLRQLTDMVVANLKNHKMAVPGNLAQIVEHQICLRHSKPLEVCWEDGLGDHVHHSWVKPVAERVASKIQNVAPAVANVIRKVSGCSGCGGTKTYEAGKNNLGRAKYLNQIAPR